MTDSRYVLETDPDIADLIAPRHCRFTSFLHIRALRSACPNFEGGLHHRITREKKKEEYVVCANFIFGSTEAWIRGSMDPWIHGSVKIRK